MHLRHAVLLLLLAVPCVGCGPSFGTPPGMYPARGTVTLANGKPATGALIRFVPMSLEGVETYTELNEDGSFVLKTVADRDGAVPSRYKVYFDTDSASPRPPAKTAAAKQAIPRAYLKAETTPLVLEVKPEENTFAVKLK